MILREAIDSWLNRPLRRLSKLKKLKAEEVDRRISVLDPAPVFHTEPRLHQKIAFLAASYYDSLMLLWGMGLGKTFATYMIIDDKLRCGVAKKALVLVPTVTVCGVWLDEARLHVPHLKVQVIDGVGRRARTAQIKSDADVTVITYQGMLSLCSKTERSTKNANKNRWVIDPKADKIIKQFQILVCDESTAIKARDSLYFYLAKRVAKYARFRYCLTGTPFGADSQDMWAQYYVVDLGESLGSSLGLLREACYEGEPSYYGGTEWKLKESHEDDIRRFIDHSTLHYDEKECLDLPPQVFQTIHVPRSSDFQAHYDKAIRDMREARGNVSVMENTFHLMRQLTSGFVTGRDTSGNKQFSDLECNPKLDACEELIRSVPADRKLVIFNTYVHTGEMIEGLVRRIGGLEYERVWGSTTRKMERVDRFRNDPSCRVLILNDQAGALGLNLQVANYVIFYETPISPITYQQACKRCHRSGQSWHVYYYYLIMRHTVDRRILASVLRGENFMKNLLSGEIKIEDGMFS